MLGTIERVELANSGDMIIGGNYQGLITFDDGTVVDGDWIGNESYGPSAIFLARRPTF